MPVEIDPEKVNELFDQQGSPFDQPIGKTTHTPSGIIGKEHVLQQIEITVRGAPLASNNLKFNRRTGFAYRPPEHKQRIFSVHEYAEKTCAELGITDFPVFPKGVALWMRADLIFPYRKQDYRTGSRQHLLKPNAPHWVTTKKDIDNILKPLKDGLSGIVYHDDSQVCRYDRIEKVYGEQPCSIITIGRLDYNGQGIGGNQSGD